jgi:carbonic anhydrase
MRKLRWSLLAIGLLVAVVAPARAAMIPQSPIDIKNPVAKKLAALTFDYPVKVALDVTTTRSAKGTTESIKAKTNNVATVQIGTDDNKYKLKDFHFHIHSEHTLDGLIFSMELHMVHERTVKVGDKDVTQSLAVGRWIKEGAENDVLKVMFNNFPAVPPLGAPLNPPVNPFPIADFNLNGLLPAANKQSSYRYSGSLTTGLKEIEGQTISETPVSWILFHDPLFMSREQITKYRNHFPNGNWRETWPHVAGANGHGLMTDVGVPEPSTLGLLAVAALVMGASRKRR